MSDAITIGSDAFTLSTTALRLVAPHVSGEASRPTLSCLYLEAGGVMVATDGHTLAAYPDAHDAPTDLLLLADWPKLLRGKMGEDTRIEITPESEGVRFLATNPATGVVVRGTFGEGPFPSWRAVVRPILDPVKGDRAPDAVAFNPTLLARFRSLLPSRQKDGPIELFPTGDNTRCYRVVVPAYPALVALAMPCRVGPSPDVPEFVVYRATPKGVAS